ncbi:hypothetical protein ADP71_09560 [Vitreoscilla sp. C1]|uniref:TPM domain-containing protein n=1 Tax=Vitreoscilla sp. (strain C1) TaxID=96942 RepID=UPI00148ECAF0|nr:TPM domain-containing protein [Vitreoscilla sp. C1]AUZ04669.2 hypothetical protein ADP71_09560 [Vitreoscilla sp. C1]
MAQIMDVRVWQQGWVRLFLSVCLVMVMPWAWADNLQPIPDLTGPVIDQAQIMSPERREQLNQELRQYTREKGSQVVVLTVNTTAPEDVFSYGIRVVQAWKLGRAQEQDGVLLLIAKDDRNNQILVGRGLEGAITDVDAHRILSEVVRPQFQQDNFDQGIVDAVAKIQGLIAGEALPEASMEESFGSTWDILLALLLPLLIFTTVMKKIFGKQWGSLLSAVLVVGLLSLFELSWLLLLAVSAGVYLFSILVNVNLANSGGGGWHGDSGGWHDSGSSGGGWSSSDSYSGGGGGFSGGGASGDW